MAPDTTFRWYFLLHFPLTLHIVPFNIYKGHGVFSEWRGCEGGELEAVAAALKGATALESFYLHLQHEQDFFSSIFLPFFGKSSRQPASHLDLHDFNA